MGPLPKPQLRGGLRRHIIKSLIGATIGTTVIGALVHFCYLEPRKKRFAEFRRTYNADEHMKLLMKYGYIDLSSPLDD